MGTAPQPPGPPADPPGLITADAGLKPGPKAISLCGFNLFFPPTIYFKFGFNLPSFHFPPPLPTFNFSLSLNCDINNPISVSAGITWGGGRKVNAAPDPDLLEQAGLGP